jgi:Asp-tRNA(Asn)/Glu-tRNA(Gln) amidotransferase A subunit family amidase
MPTCYNSPIYKNDGPSLVDAAPIITLRTAGALIFGKTTTTEFASTIDGGPSTNPHDSGRTPGGSSSGSGAAVGDYQVLGSIPILPNMTDIPRSLSDLVLKQEGV